MPLGTYIVLVVQGNELKGEVEGILAMKQSWPSIMRTLYGDHKRYEETYFSAYKVHCQFHAVEVSGSRPCASARCVSAKSLLITCFECLYKASQEWSLPCVCVKC